MSDMNQFPSPVLVPATEQLLGQMNRFHAGILNRDDFVADLQGRVKGVERALTHFLPSVPISSRPEAAEKQRGSLNILAGALNDIATVIPQMLEYAESGSEEAYQYLLVRLGRILAVERAAIDQYHHANIPDGPTDMPFVNAVYHAQKRYYAGEITEEAYVKVINSIIEKLEDAYTEANERTSFDASAKSELLYAYRSFIEALETVRSYIAEGEAYASGLMKNVTDSARQVLESIKIYTLHANTSGPTRMIQSNLMINMAEACQQGRLDPNVFLRALDIFAENLDRTWRQIQALASLPHDSAEKIAELMDTLRAAYEEQFRAVELYRAGIAGDSESLAAARELMISGSEKAADCREAFQTMGDNVGKVPCMRCGTYNMPGSRTCEKCGSRLLAADGLEGGSSTISYQEEGGAVSMGGDFKLTPQIRALFEAVNAVTEGRCSGEDFAEAVNTYRSFVAKTYDVDTIAEHLLAEAKDETGTLPQRVEDVSSDLSIAVQGLNEALDTLDQYVSDANSQYIFDGVLGIRDSSIKLQKALEKVKAIVSGKNEAEEESSPMAGFDAVLADGDDASVGYVG